MVDQEVKLRLPDESDVLLKVRPDLPQREIDERMARYSNQLRALNQNHSTATVGYTDELADALVSYRTRLFKANKIKDADDARARRQAESDAIIERQNAAHEAELQKQGKETLEAARSELEAAWRRQGGTKASFDSWWTKTGEEQELARRAVAAVERKRNMAAQPGRDY